MPQEWFGNVRGKELLRLASGGGEQVPLFAAAGAQVTSFDNSPVQLAKDEYVALRDGLDIAYEQDDMADLSRFDDECFDLMITDCCIDRSHQTLAHLVRNGIHWRVIEPCDPDRTTFFYRTLHLQSP